MFGIGDALFVVDGEKQVVVKLVVTMSALPFPVVIILNGHRKPHILICFLKMHRTIFDDGEISIELN